MELFVIAAITVCIGWFIIFYYPNASAPIIQKEARVVSKRSHVSGNQSRISTQYYVTFEFPDRNRAEFNVRAFSYGCLVEGDYGTLHVQGIWFHEFDRH